MEHDAKSICKTFTSGKEQNFNKRMDESFSTLYVHFGQIQYFFKVMKTDLTIIQYQVGTLYR